VRSWRILGRSIAPLAVAIVWAAVIAASAVLLRGSPGWPRELLVLGGGSAATLLIVGAAVRHR
jgi:hypothetical protein